MTATDPVLPKGPEDCLFTLHWYPRDWVPSWSASSVVRADEQFQFIAKVENSRMHKKAHISRIEIRTLLPKMTAKEWHELTCLAHDQLEALVGKPVNAIDRSYFTEVLQ